MPETSRRPRIALGSEPRRLTSRKPSVSFSRIQAAEDLGAWSEESVDHPDYGKGLGKSVGDRKDDYGIAVRGRWPRDPRCQPRPGA